MSHNHSAIILKTFHAWAARPQIATAIVPAYAPCDHGAIGPCALCLGPCESCGANYEDGKAKHFPVSPRRDKDGHLECAECLLSAGHLEVEPVRVAYEPDWDAMAKYGDIQ